MFDMVSELLTNTVERVRERKRGGEGGGGGEREREMEREREIGGREREMFYWPYNLMYSFSFNISQTH